jgi:hypothetical protein
VRAIRLLCAAALAAFALGGATLAASGCDDGNTLLLCGEIPAKGCPLGRGGSCDDDACAGLYDCVGGKWTLSVDCAADGGASTSSSTGSGGDAGADAMCTPAVISHAGEAIGCQPGLQEPDCPAAVIDGACAETVCLTGCTDFYLCVHDPAPSTGKSWSAVAYCDENGELIIAP